MRKEIQENIPRFGLLGRNISYSFSRGYFSEKFRKEGIEASYENFDIPEISLFRDIVLQTENLQGLNVTIPYKEQVLPFLDEIDPIAEKIGAVNTIKILPGKRLKGFNTDFYGFSESIKPLLQKKQKKALIIGTGGASKAIFFALSHLQISPTFVSRTSGKNLFTYSELTKEVLQDHLVIVNCTPLGTSPEILKYPPIPIDFITSEHLIFDLIYNPAETRLMKLAAEKGARVSNGLKMLELQAEKSWKLWH